MTLPVLKVEIGFGYTALDTITWTDVSTYVRGFSSQRGRSTELDSTPTGTCTIVLNNRTRRFDPEYAAGPYYANLVSNVPVRVTCTHTAVTYSLFYGYVDGWPQTYEPVGDSTVSLSCSDAFSLFNRWQLPESVYAYEVAQDTPHAWWRLGDSDGTVAIDSSGNGYDGVYQGEPAHVAGLVDGSSDQAVSATNGSVGEVLVGNTAAFIADVPFTIEAWVRAHYPIGALSGGRGAGAISQNSPTTRVSLSVSAFGQNVQALWAMPTGGGATSYFIAARDTAATPDVFFADAADDRVHHIAVTVTSGNVGILYFDGVAVQSETTSIAFSAYATSSTMYVAGYTQDYDGEYAYIDEVAIYPVVLTPAQIAAHYAAGRNPWEGDNTGTRLGRILDMIGWPAALRSIDTGESILGPATLASRTVLDYIQQIAATEQARLFMGPDGKLVFQQRDHDLTLTSQATFTDDGTNVDYLTSGFRFSKDARFTFNEVTASREGSSNAITVGTGDPLKVTKSITGLLVQSDTEVRNIAESFLWRYQTPVTRVDGWTVRPEKRPTKWPIVLGLEIGERVTLQRTPMELGAQISKDFIIESDGWNVVPGDWSVSYSGSPVDPTSYFVVGTSQAGGTDVIR